MDLESPAHLFALDALTEVFPDACLVQTHRDPLEVVPSGCSFLLRLVGLVYDQFGPKEAADFFLETTLASLDRSMQVRESIDPLCVFDLHFNQLMQYPLGSVRQIYQHFHYEFSPEIERRMECVLEEQPRHKYGVHRYSLAQFGLEADDIDRLFEPYCRRFDIPRERPCGEHHRSSASLPETTASGSLKTS